MTELQIVALIETSIMVCLGLGILVEKLLNRWTSS